MILWRNIENCPFFSFDSDPRFPPFLLYVRCKPGVTFVRRCFRDVNYFWYAVAIFDLVHAVEAIFPLPYQLTASGNLF